MVVGLASHPAGYRFKIAKATWERNKPLANNTHWPIYLRRQLCLTVSVLTILIRS